MALKVFHFLIHTAGILKGISSLIETLTILCRIVTKESTEEEDKIILQPYQWLLWDTTLNTVKVYQEFKSWAEVHMADPRVCNFSYEHA